MRYRQNPFHYSPRAHSVRRALVLVMLLLALPLLADGGQKNTITGIETNREGNQLKILLKGSSVPTYTVYELFKPSRIVVDVAEAELGPSFSAALPQDSGIRLETSTIGDAEPPLTRFTFVLDHSSPFTVNQEGNDIVVAITAQKEKPSRQAAAVTAKDDREPAVISDVRITTAPLETVVELIADRPLSYSHDVLDKKKDSPPRLYLDIDNAKGDTLLKEQKVGTALAAIRVAKRGSGLRFVLDGSGDTLFPFRITPKDKGLAIHIQEKGGKDEISKLIQEKETIEKQLPKVDLLNPPDKGEPGKTLAAKMEDAFTFAGYNKERITVDFYKIDLHNVFRLLREVSGKNIVVDEAVNGSLTLALNDVPWDFALDIILNLKDLQKEERYNTIVIHPKSKEFSWPQRAEDNLSFEADEKLTEQEAILIQQQMAISPTVIEARKFIAQAKNFEKREEYESAVSAYEKALDKWPDNARMANRIASIYLVRLRQNAKALHFARKALEIDPHMATAALNAAIASANMKENTQAQHYFDQAVNGSKPLREALLSYAVFSEEQKLYPEAIQLLMKHDQIYGENLDSMLAKARILDKEGKHADATAAYRKIMLSGYRIPPDLRKFIQGRVALSQPK